MRGMTSVRLAGALALVVGVAACSDDDDPTGPGDAELSSEEADLMMEAWMELGGLGVGVAFNPASERDDVLHDSGSQEFNEQQACPEGGTLSLEGTMAWDENAWSWDLTNTADDCGSTDSEGNVWTFNGGMNTTFNMTGDENYIDMSGSQQGTLSFSSDVGSGSCTIDVQYSAEGTQTGGTAQVSGSVCGHDVSQSDSW